MTGYTAEVYVPPAKPCLANLTQDFDKITIRKNKVLHSITRPHIAAFNAVLCGGLKESLLSLPPLEFALPDETRVKLVCLGGSIGKPRVPETNMSARDPRVFPSEARQGAQHYSGRLVVRFSLCVNGEQRGAMDRNLGEVPVMVMSDNCHLKGLSPAELVRRGELEHEMGGYFITRGGERVLRMQVATRRNYPLCISRKSYKSYGKLFTDFAIQIRSMTDEHTVTTNMLHFLSNGSCKLIFRWRRERFCVSPILIIRSLLDLTDRDIYRRLTEPDDSDYYTSCIASMLRDAQTDEQDQPLVSQRAVRNYLGALYRLKMFARVADWDSDEAACDMMHQDAVLIHLNEAEQKVEMLCFMIRKLFCFVRKGCAEESPDNPMLWEVQHGSYLYQQVIKNKVLNYMFQFREVMLRKAKKKPLDYEVTEGEMTQTFNSVAQLGDSITTFVSTGNVPQIQNIIASDSSGLSVVAEKISHTRYMSHFRSIHRGNFFTTMRTTSVRQLLPEAWGFICPVHTPDGAPCGLLNHLTATCEVSAGQPDRDVISQVVFSLGVTPVGHMRPAKKCYTVLLDGAVIGKVAHGVAQRVVDRLRYMKCHGEVYQYLEVALLPERGGGGQFPALYVFSSDSRLMRPVLNLQHQKIEYIGTLEQVYLNVAVRLSEAPPGTYTHAEVDDTSLLSHQGLLVPMSDLNQSPRNMYQCQMSKQTMGTPRVNWPGCSENKLYRLQTPHAPFFRPTHHDAIDMDNMGQGTNAIVAVVSYTGYDMEDAMIINKHAQERGLACGFIYKTKIVSLVDKDTFKDNRVNYVFRRDEESAEDLKPFMDADGIPHIGVYLQKSSPIACWYSLDENRYHVDRYMDDEPCRVDSVKLMGNPSGSEVLQRIMVVLRVERKPTVGDKFASRAGQKGICSRLHATEDLPWTESGLMPDIIFNPHGFPSRMTIAMMVECMAGKAGAINGECYDATPFRFNEKQTAIDYFGTILEQAGYDYYGTETLYSGFNGEQMEARIFFGIIHYQRLRHMVSDKWQVRSTGPMNTVTRQPVKGRKKGGGVRFGEMERDGVMAHGTSLIVQDRLFVCSDKTELLVCGQCGSMLSAVTELTSRRGKHRVGGKACGHRTTCTVCESARHVVSAHVPYVLLHLATQLAAMNVRVNVQLKQV